MLRNSPGGLDFALAIAADDRLRLDRLGTERAGHHQRLLRSLVGAVDALCRNSSSDGRQDAEDASGRLQLPDQQCVASRREHLNQRNKKAEIEREQEQREHVPAEIQVSQARHEEVAEERDQRTLAVLISHGAPSAGCGGNLLGSTTHKVSMEASLPR